MATHMQLGIWPGNTWGDPEPSPPADLQALHKQKMKTKAELSTTRPNVEGVSQHAHRAPSLGDLSVPGTAFKEIILPLSKGDQWSHTIKSTDWRVHSEKSLNKQLQQAAITRSPEKGRIWFPELSYYIILNVEFLTKKKKHVKKHASMVLTQGNKQLIKIIPEVAQTLD